MKSMLVGIRDGFIESKSSQIESQVFGKSSRMELGWFLRYKITATSESRQLSRKE